MHTRLDTWTQHCPKNLLELKIFNVYFPTPSYNIKLLGERLIVLTGLVFGYFVHREWRAAVQFFLPPPLNKDTLSLPILYRNTIKRARKSPRKYHFIIIMPAVTDLKQTDSTSCKLFCSLWSGRKGNRMRLAISRSTQALCMLCRLKRVAALICPVMFISSNEGRTPS